MDSRLQFAAKLARETGELLLTHFKPGGSHASVKEDYSVLTQADLAADRYITQAIRSQYPDDQILSEESRTTLPPEPARTVWVIDPLDGTTNFSLGLHVWGVAIALLVDGWPQIAALNFPLLNELYTAQHEKGAWLNQNPIHVKEPDPKQPAAFFICCSRTYRRYKVSVPYKTRILGAAAYGFCTVARGAAVLGFEATPKIWDIAAGWLLVHEAGGVVAPHQDAKPFPIQHGLDYNMLSFPTISAPTEKLVTRARGQLVSKQGAIREMNRFL